MNLSRHVEEAFDRGDLLVPRRRRVVAAAMALPRIMPTFSAYNSGLPRTSVLGIIAFTILNPRGGVTF